MSATQTRSGPPSLPIESVADRYLSWFVLGLGAFGVAAGLLVSLV